MSSLHPKSIRSFIGAHDFAESRQFYRQLGFTEVSLGPKMSYFRIAENIGFYLQNAYVKDWVDNTMLFLEIADLEAWRMALLDKDLERQYPKVRISTIREEDWGREFFVHDPSGILWHFGEFF